MDVKVGFEFLRTHLNNYYRHAYQVDLELMPPDRRDVLIYKPELGASLTRATQLGRQTSFAAVWTFWENYSRELCDNLLSKCRKQNNESCVDWVGRSLAANGVSFPNQDWFTSAYALRNLIVHYSGRALASRAEKLHEKAKVAFQDLELFPDKYVLIQTEHISGIFWEIEEFMRAT